MNDKESKFSAMDRRQIRTREAVFKALIQLLSKKDFMHITVKEIVSSAGVGRATFYDNFETKDFLLKELCEEFFCHIFDSLNGNIYHRHIFECDAPDSVFLHLFRHLQKNDNNILKLLAGPNNELFLGYFKESLKKLVESQMLLQEFGEKSNLPEELFKNYVVSTFVDTVKWWVDNGKKETPEMMTEYFYELVK